MTTNETPTPRTDALYPDNRPGAYDQMSQHARELERELAEARKQLADWQVLQATTEKELAREKLRAEENGKLAHNLGIELVAERKDHAATADMLTTLRCELEDERKLSTGLAEGQGKLIAQNLKMKEQLAAERALADRLAGAIEAHEAQFPDDALNGELELWSHLAAWKEARREAQ